MTTTISAINFGNLKPLEIFIGFLIAFAVCLLLMFAFKSIASAIKDKRKPASEEIACEDSSTEPAKGSCGELKLVNTDERTAAMIMAIVADQTKTPLNELRFVSIEKKQEDDK